MLLSSMATWSYLPLLTSAINSKFCCATPSANRLTPLHVPGENRPTIPKSINATRPSSNTRRFPACTSCETGGGERLKCQIRAEGVHKFLSRRYVPYGVALKVTGALNAHWAEYCLWLPTARFTMTNVTVSWSTMHSQPTVFPSNLSKQKETLLA